jgi:hypothetical protein
MVFFNSWGAFLRRRFWHGTRFPKEGFFGENSVFGLRLGIRIAYAGGLACANLGMGLGRAKDQQHPNNELFIISLTRVTKVYAVEVQRQCSGSVCPHHSKTDRGIDVLRTLYINCYHLT